MRTSFGADNFPFTEPSFQGDILFNGTWMEILGCGVIHPNILESLNLNDEYTGGAFGMGLERLAMILFGIPDIKLFWTDDERFMKQFSSDEFKTKFERNEIVKFKPYSVLKPVQKYICFWINNAEELEYVDSTKFKWKCENDFSEIVRTVFKDTIDEVALQDSFYKEKTKQYSVTYRLSITYNTTDPAKQEEYANERVTALQREMQERGYPMR